MVVAPLPGTRQVGGAAHQESLLSVQLKLHVLALRLDGLHSNNDSQREGRHGNEPVLWTHE